MWSYILTLVVFLSAGYVWTRPRSPKDPNRALYPPEVWLPRDEQFRNPREAYEKVLREHGPIVGVRRNGKLEYIVSHQYVKELLTQEQYFSFEQSAAATTNKSGDEAFIHDFRKMQGILMDVINTHMDETVKRVSAVYVRRANELIGQHKPGEPFIVDSLFQYNRESVAEALLITLLGKEYVNENSIRAAYTAAAGLARLTVIHGSSSFFGRTVVAPLRTYTRFPFLLLSNCIRFFRYIAPQIWKNMTKFEKNYSIPKEAKAELEPNLVNLLMADKIDPSTGKIPLKKRIRITMTILAIVFASIHTTAVATVWIFYILSTKSEYLAPLQQEISEMTEVNEPGRPPHINLETLQHAKLLDSFVREVFRLRGLTLFSSRMATCDAPLGKYIIPKGHKVWPLSTNVHESTELYGPNAKVFNGFQWADQEKPASMVGESFVAFGLGRYACPGRHLAVNGIKLLVLSILSRASPNLAGNKYEVIDPMYVASVPPRGTFILTPLKTPLM